MGAVVCSEGCNNWFVVFNCDCISRVVTSKSLSIVSSESGITLNYLKKYSVAVNTEIIMESIEVVDVDPDSLGGAEEHKDLGGDGPRSNSKVDNV